MSAVPTGESSPLPRGRLREVSREDEKALRPRTVLFFGTYDARRYQRVAVLREGFTAAGDVVLECNVPLRLGTAARVKMLRRPWRLGVLALHMGRCWWRLWRTSRQLPPVDLVVVGYMGHFDVHLARRLFPDVPVVLDFLVSARDTAVDRGCTSRPLLAVLGWLDRAAVKAADIPCVDTHGSLALLRPEDRPRAQVVPVGATGAWFGADWADPDGALRVVFFGSFTPLQGAAVIAEAAALVAARPSARPVRFTLVGTGQDYEEARRIACDVPGIDWIDWVAPEDLPALVARHDVCLGIFGSSPKARRVVPTKVFQGAAAGCAIVTSDTPAQRRALSTAGVYVAPGDARALADAIVALADDHGSVIHLRSAAARRAREHFGGRAVTSGLCAATRAARTSPRRSRRAYAPSRRSEAREAPARP